MGEEASFEMLEFMSAALFSLRVPSFKILFYRPADIVWEKKNCNRIRQLYFHLIRMHGKLR